jgi:SAM-dependent methyltransferase
MEYSSAKYELISCVNCGSPPEEHEHFIGSKVAHHGHMYGDPLEIVVCSKCGLVFLNPQPTREALDQFYREEYYQETPLYSDIDALKSTKIWQRDFLFTWLVEHIPEGINDWDILDIGSGFGVWLQWFDSSNRLSGIDSSKQASKVAQELFGINAYQMDFLTNDLKDGQFDLITGLAIIEHFNDPLEALIELNRLLKTGGYLYLQTPDIHGLVLRQGISRYFKVVHTFYFSILTLSSLLTKSGFDIIATRRRSCLVETSGILYPNNYWSGELDLLAIKRSSQSLDDAKSRPAEGNDLDAAVSSLRSALKRDRFYINYAKLYRLAGIRILFKGLFKIADLIKLPKSIFEVQAELLGLKFREPTGKAD